MGVPISNVTRRVVYAASGTGPYNFTFEILANTDVAVYRDDTLLTLTTDYTVTINANGTGYITLTASPTGATQIAIVGNRTIQRTSDFVTGGDFFANTVNDELDQLTIFAQQNAEGIDRALKAPQTDPTSVNMTLPRASVRANKTLAFDSNGNPVTGEVIGDNRGNWASGTAYNKRDIVRDNSNGNVYYANTAHTSSGTTPISSNADAAKWDLIVNNAAAGASATAAANSATAAATSATNAASSATAAAGSASTASTQASNASTSATNAANSATAASGSASTASTAATNASNSATAAATSATNASNSASAASTSATNAASSASAASTSASNASTSATNAANSATSASSSASTATTQATNASNSASAAATSATNAASSASTASTQATNASNSATAAAASAAAAAASYDSFDDRYLGTKSSAPTLDNDGNALVTGALYYNTTTQVMNVYDGANWIAATAAGTAAMTRYRYVATAGQTTFSGTDANSLTLSYTANNIIVARNGSMLDPSEYTATNGTSVVLSVAAALNDVVDIVAFKSFTVASVDGQNLVNASVSTSKLVDASVTTAKIANGAIIPVDMANGGAEFGMRNRIINGGMVIDQRNAGASVSTSSGASVYTVDRFQLQYSQTSKITAQQNANSITPPPGYIGYLGITSASAYSVGATDYFTLTQKIEGYNVADLGWGAAGASTVTLSFWVRSSLTGAFGGVITNTNFDRSYPFTYTISAANTWEQKTITIAGDTTGTWNKTNGTNIQVQFGLGVGSTYSGTAGAWAAAGLLSATGATSVVGTNGATWYVTGVQLEKGSTATPFEYRHFTTELQLCQRYYEIFSTPQYGMLAICQAAGSGSGYSVFPCRVQKRAIPTFTITGTAPYPLTAAGGLAGAATYALDQGSLDVQRVGFTGSSGLTAGNATALYANSTAVSFNFNAEL